MISSHSFYANLSRIHSHDKTAPGDELLLLDEQNYTLVFQGAPAPSSLQR